MANYHREMMNRRIEQSEQKQREAWASAAAEKEKREREKEQRRTETRRFWIQTVITSIAAVSALLGVLLQILR